MTRKKAPGVTLIVVLGVLTLMVLLATVFASMTSTERSISRNYLDTVRAKLAAQTGIDRSLELIMGVVEKGWFDKGEFDKAWMYYGSQSNESMAPVPGTRLEEAVNPSFAWETEATQNPYDNNSLPRTLTVRGKPIGLSGFLPGGTYGDNGDFYSLKVLDCQSMINVNDGHKGGRNFSVSQNLERILNNFGRIPTIDIPNLGTNILNNRPPGGYRNKYELMRAVNYDMALFDKIKDYVTVSSWTDSMVANPVPLSGAVLNKYKGVTYERPTDMAGQPIYRYGHNVNQAGFPINQGSFPLQFFDPAMSTSPFHNAIWEMDSLSPQYVELVDRSPVNLNTASREVLIALISELQGFYVMGQRRNTPTALDYNWMVERYTYDQSAPAEEVTAAGSDVLAWIYSTTPFDQPVSSGTGVLGPMAPERIADEIIACRSGGTSPALNVSYKTLMFGGHFRSWAQWNEFLDYLVDQNVIQDPRSFYDYHNGAPAVSPVQKTLASRAIADVLKANFNPNLHLNELNPNKVLYTLVDKTDMICNSTEGCFTPMGTFEIESLGYVVKPAGGTDALTATNNEIVASQKITTVVKLYDAIRDTAQSQFYQGDFGPRAMNPTTNNDRAVECGPEPDNGPMPGEADYEGYVGLATLFSDYHGQGQLVNAGGGGNRNCPGVTVQPFWWFWRYKHWVWDDANFVYVRIDWWNGDFYQWDIPKSMVGGTAWHSLFGPMDFRTQILQTVQHGLDHYAAGERNPPSGGTWGGSGFSGINAAWGGMPKAKSTYLTTEPSGAYYPGVTCCGAGQRLFQDSIHAHYRLDHVAHYNKFGNAANHLPSGAFAVQGGILNHNDRTESIPGPYGPVDGSRINKAGRYRLGKGFRTTPSMLFPGTTTVVQTPPPQVERATSSDLRMDGAYCEHNSAFAYQISNSFDISKGAIGFWMKPNYTPEATGKTRLLTGITRFTNTPYLDASGKRTQLFALYLFPYHRFYPNPAAYGLFEEPYAPIGNTGFTQTVIPRPISMTTIWSYSAPGVNGGGSATFSPTLNHKFHGSTEGPTNFVGTDGKLNHMRSNEWMYVLIAWRMVKGVNKTWKADKNKWVVIETGEDTIEMGIFANGMYLPGSAQVIVATPDAVQNSDKKWDHKVTGQNNSIRVGGEYGRPISNITNVAHKYFADATIDEFFYWDDDKLGVDMGTKIASYGRYYKAIDTNPDSAVFISRNFGLSAFVGRPYPDPSGVSTPSIISTGSPIDRTGVGGGGPLTTTTAVNIPAPAQKRAQVIAIQWTALAEEYQNAMGGFIVTGGAPQARMKPVMYDYNRLLTQNQAPIAMTPQALPDCNNFTMETVVDAYVIVDGTTYGPYRNEPWSPIRMAHANGTISTGTGATRLPPTVTSELKYRAKFRVGLNSVTQGLNAMLLTTPYLDDVTLFYTKGEVEYLSWTVNP